MVLDGRFKNTQKLQPQIKYKYSVNGQQYIGSKIYINDKGVWTEDQILRELKEYAKSSNIPVYYDPENPEESVLKKKITYEKIYIYGVIGILSIVCAIFLRVLLNYAIRLTISISRLQSKRLK